MHWFDELEFRTQVELNETKHTSNSFAYNMQNSLMWAFQLLTNNRLLYTILENNIHCTYGIHPTFS